MLPLEAQEESPSFASSSFRWLPPLLDSQPLQWSLPPWSHCLLLFYLFQISFCLSFMWTLLTTFSAYPDNPGLSPHLKTLSLITSIKIQHLQIPGIKTWYIWVETTTTFLHFPFLSYFTSFVITKVIGVRYRRSECMDKQKKKIWNYSPKISSIYIVGAYLYSFFSVNTHWHIGFTKISEIQLMAQPLISLQRRPPHKLGNTVVTPIENPECRNLFRVKLRYPSMSDKLMSECSFWNKKFCNIKSSW